MKITAAAYRAVKRAKGSGLPVTLSVSGTLGNYTRTVTLRH